MRVPIAKHFTVKAVIEARLDRESVPGQRLPPGTALCADFALGLEIGASVLEGERTYYDAAGAPVFFSITFYRADRHRFTATLRKWR